MVPPPFLFQKEALCLPPGSVLRRLSHTQGRFYRPLFIRVGTLSALCRWLNLYSSPKPLSFLSQYFGILQVYRLSKEINVNVAGDLRCGSTEFPLFWTRGFDLPCQGSVSYRVWAIDYSQCLPDVVSLFLRSSGSLTILLGASGF